MFKKIFSVAIGSIFGVAMWTNVASAVVVDAEGSVGSGLNDDTSTAMDVGILEGDSFFFDIDCANDCDSNSDDDNGLDTWLWLFDSSATLIASNDDSDFFNLGGSNAGTDPGSDIYGDYDSFIGEISLGSGVYYIAVSYYGNTASSYIGDVLDNLEALSLSGDNVIGAASGDGFENDQTCGDDPADECSGQYQLQIRTSFTDYVGQLTIDGWVGAETDGNDVDFYKFTVRNIKPFDVPEPAPFALLGLGLIGLGLVRRRRR